MTETTTTEAPADAATPAGQEGFAGGTMAALGSGTLGSFALAAAPAWPFVLGALAVGGAGGYLLTRRGRKKARQTK